ncbi:PC-esterase domain-containing protein 1A-like isoform X2 [Erythrolamprus reginae]
MKKASFLLAEIHNFTSEEAQQLLHNKFVVVIGDSNYRAIYKDLIYFLQTDEFLTTAQLKDKNFFPKDSRVHLKESSGNDYRQVRQYRTRHHLVRFYFITRVYSSYVDDILNDLRAALEADLVPDVVIVHSCLWDLNRYHDMFPTEPPLPKAIREYRQNVEKLFQALDEVLPSSTLVIWNTGLALGENPRGYIIEQPHKMSDQDMIEANFYSADLARGFWFDVLDLHYHFRFLQGLHATDGTHWNSWAHRYLTKLLLTHLAEAWQVQLQKERPKMDIQMFQKAESRPPPSPWSNVDPATPQLIPTLWTNGSGRGSSHSRRLSYLRHRAHRKRFRARTGPSYHPLVQFGGAKGGGLHQEGDPWPFAGPMPDAMNSPPGLDWTPRGSPNDLLPTPGYYPPRGPECGVYDRWPIGSFQPGHFPPHSPDFNPRAPPHMGLDSLLPSLCYYDGPSHDPFYAGCDVSTPISGQEEDRRPNAGYPWVPDSSAAHSRPVPFVEQGDQFSPSPYVPPFHGGSPTTFADQGPRFHSDSPPHFPQGLLNFSLPLSTAQQGQSLQPQQTPHGPDYSTWVTSWSEEAPFHPRGDLPVHHNVRSGPWSMEEDGGDPAFPSHGEEKHCNCFSGPEESFTHEEEGWASYTRRPRCGAQMGSRKMLPKHQRANHRRQACAPYATSRRPSKDSY